MNKKEKQNIIKLLKFIKKSIEKEEDGDIPTRQAYIDKYIQEYSKDTVKFTQRTFIDCHDPKSEAPDLENTVRKYMGNQFRPFLDEFFNTTGKNLEYKLVIPKGKYYLELRKNKHQTDTKQIKIHIEPNDASTNKEIDNNFTLPTNASSTTKDKIRGFFEIIPEALFTPIKLITRSRGSKFVNIDALALFLFVMVLSVSIMKAYIDSLNNSSFSIFFAFEFGKIKEKVYNIIHPLILMFSAFIAVIYIFILWALYKTFKGSATFYETLNFQLYFLSGWLPFIVLLKLSDIKQRIWAANTVLTGILWWIILFVVSGYMILCYFATLNKLMGLTHKRGIFPFLLYCVIASIFMTLFSPRE